MARKPPSLPRLIVAELWIHASRGAARNMALSPRTPPARPPFYIVTGGRRPISVTALTASPASPRRLRPLVCILLPVAPPITQASPRLTRLRTFLAERLASAMRLLGPASRLLRPEAGPIALTPRLASIILLSTPGPGTRIWTAE